MKPKNFPERKNQRRKIALQEVENRLKFWKTEEKNPVHPDGFHFSDVMIYRGIKLAEAEIGILSARIVPSARNVQSKKFGTKILRQEARHY